MDKPAGAGAGRGRHVYSSVPTVDEDGTSSPPAPSPSSAEKKKRLVYTGSRSLEEASMKRLIAVATVAAGEGKGAGGAATPGGGELPWRAGWAWLRAALVLSAAFFMQFTAWHATQNLQSTLPLPPEVSGTAALAIVYLCSTVTVRARA
jgi:hypothetical protein